MPSWGFNPGGEKSGGSLQGSPIIVVKLWTLESGKIRLEPAEAEELGNNKRRRKFQKTTFLEKIEPTLPRLLFAEKVFSGQKNRLEVKRPWVAAESWCHAAASPSAAVRPSKDAQQCRRRCASPPRAKALRRRAPTLAPTLAPRADPQSADTCWHGTGCSQQALDLSEREGMLREQMNTYGDKFKELQETLTKSNEVFASFKKDSERMQKRIKASEKERLVAEKLAHKSVKELADLTEKHEPLKKDSANLKRQKERMEAMCRTLTKERADLKDKLRALGALPGPDLTPSLPLPTPDAEAGAPAAAEPVQVDDNPVPAAETAAADSAGCPA